MSDTMLMMLVAVAAELVLLLFVFMTVAVLRGRSAKQRDADAMRALVARVRKEKPQREQSIEKFLVHGMGMSGEALEQAKVAMVRAELALLQRFVSVYRGRDAALAGRFDGDVIAALAPYYALTASGAVAADVAADNAADSAELEALRKENTRLEDELRITMETMSRMLNEYSTMFAGGAPDHAAPIAGAAAAATVPAAEASADDVAEIAQPVEGEADEAVEPLDMDIAAAADPVVDDIDQDDAVEAADDLFDESTEPTAEPAWEVVTEEAVTEEVTAEDVEGLFDELPEEPDDIAPAGASAEEPGIDVVPDTDDLFDSSEVELTEMEPEPELSSESDIASLADAPAVEEAASEENGTAEPGIEDDDPIAQILREAQSQEQSARGNPVDVAADQPPAAVMPDHVALPASPGSGEGTEYDTDPADAPLADTLLEEGEIEVMSFAEDQVEIAVADDELFDAVDIDGPEFDAPARPPEASEDELFDAVDSDDRKSGSAI